MQPHHLGGPPGIAQAGGDALGEVDWPSRVGPVDRDHAIAGQRANALDETLDEGGLGDRNELRHSSIRANRGHGRRRRYAQGRV